MRRPALLLVVSAAAVALAQGIGIEPTKKLEFFDCPSTGGDGGVLHAGTLAAGPYLLRVLDEKVALCEHSTGARPACVADGGACWNCADGGEFFPAGTVMVFSVPSGGKAYSCRGTGTGDVVLTQVR